MIQFSRPDIDEFFRTYAITGFTVNKAETKIAFSTNLNGKYNIWGMDLPNSFPYPLSYVDQTPAYIRFDPQDRYLLAGFDQDGDENIQMYILPPNGGALTPLRTFEGRRHYFCALSKDGNRVYYCSDKENHNFLNGYVYTISSGEESTLYIGEGGATELSDVAPDESSFITQKAYANTFIPAFLHMAGEVHSLTPDPTVPHVVLHGAYLFDQYIFSTNFNSDRTYLATFEMATKQFHTLHTLENVDIGMLAVHESTHTVYFVAHGGVEDHLYTYDVETKKASLIESPVAVVENLKVGDSGTLYILGRSDVDPFNLYKRSPDGTWTMLTNNRVMGMARDQLIPAEVVHFQSFDGLEIEALWFPAHKETANGYTVVWPHGGPQASERRMFRPFFQFLCSRGYNVWAPNFRGSAGYGAAFMQKVEGDWGHGPRLDMIESMEWLLQEGRADRDKLFLVGGSYGGYMTLLLHGRHADYFQACVDIFGPANLFTFLNSVPDFWKPMMKQWLGDPVEDKERLTNDSPITYLDGMTKPMLVVQGANDPRVVKAESDQIVQALRDRQVEVEYLVFDDEGHGFMKKANEIAAYRRIVEFLDQHRK
ncbi:MAG: alpha/beta fold hydrolase [Acidibacillus sp.]|nr:alpha/beta fold hydrolase [Acidibacillus sp.]